MLTHRGIIMKQLKNFLDHLNWTTVISIITGAIIGGVLANMGATVFEFLIIWMATIVLMINTAIGEQRQGNSIKGNRK